MFNESQNEAAEDVSETSGYSAETAETVVDFPLQVEDFASVEENAADSPAVDEQLPVVDVAPVSDGTGDNITVSEASFVETQPVAEAVPTVSSETPAAVETTAAQPAPEVREPVAEVMSKKPGSRVTVKIKGGDNWVEVRDGSKLYISKVLHDGDVYEVPAGEGMILSVGRAEGADVFIDGKLTEVVKPTKKTGIALDPFLASANH